MTCDECLKPIKADTAMVSVGYAGAINHQHYHNKCFLNHKAREIANESWALPEQPQISDVKYGDGKL